MVNLFSFFYHLFKNLKKEREEIQQMGAVGFKSYSAYLSSGWGYFGPVIVIFFFAATQGAIVLADYWLSDWYYIF
jgi:hypothetical protein